MSRSKQFRKRRHDRKYIRKEEEAERVEAWRELTPKQQLNSLDGRLGTGVGAVKQRKRIEMQMKALTEKEEAVTDKKEKKAKKKKNDD
jgi:hypothetical protein